MSRISSSIETFPRMFLIKTLISLHPPRKRWMKFFVAVENQMKRIVYSEETKENNSIYRKQQIKIGTSTDKIREKD